MTTAERATEALDQAETAIQAGNPGRAALLALASDELWREHYETGA